MQADSTNEGNHVNAVGLKLRFMMHSGMQGIYSSCCYRISKVTNAKKSQFLI